MDSRQNTKNLTGRWPMNFCVQADATPEQGPDTIVLNFDMSKIEERIFAHLSETNPEIASMTPEEAQKALVAFNESFPNVKYAS
jgi:hypothetical protein